MDTETRTLETPDVDLVYELRRPASAAEARLPLLMVGHPMDARGFDSGERSIYRPIRWGWRDAVVAAGAVAALWLAMTVGSIVGR